MTKIIPIPKPILTAEAEAKRFLARVDALKKRAAILDETGFGTREHAAVKRASMDLSRALTAIRRPQ